MTTTTQASRMLTEPWALSASVALRPEPFGALAYNFANRKLTFLKRPQLVRLVEHLGDHPDVASALAAEDIPSAQTESYLAALGALAQTEIIRPRNDA